MSTEKERLENELKLLKESFEMEVISREEYESARARIEERMQGLDTSEQKEPAAEEPKVEPEESKEEVKEEPYEEEYRPEPEDFEKRDEEQKKLDEIQEKEKTVEEISQEEKKPEEEIQIIEEKPSEAKEEKIERLETYGGKKKSGKKIFAWIVIILIIGLAGWYFFFSDRGEVPVDEADEVMGLIACSSDDDCVEEGKIGICKNPGEEDAECEYLEDAEIGLTVLNTDCFNCDTGRVLNILNSFFPNLVVENLDSETEEGKELIEDLGITALPAYILDSKFTKSHNYNRFLNLFNEVNGSFVMKSTVANANYYVKRTEIKNKLGLFYKAGQNASLEAEENLREFLEAFEGIVDFERYRSDSAIATRELEINTFPTFLVNNKVKFSGVQSADTIKENFCEMNLVEECDLELSKSLV